MTELVRTPGPKPTESLWGYLLRLTEENGYTTPTDILRLTSLDESEKKTYRFDPSVLSPLVNRPASELSHLSQGVPTTGKMSDGQLLGNPLGPASRYNMLRQWHTEFCPHCVAEDGYLDAVWELALVTACPKHRCSLLSACPHCGAALTWLRPGLLTCKCGEKLTSEHLPQADWEMTELMSILCAKVHGRSLLGMANVARFPINNLEPLSLQTICLLLISLAEQDPEFTFKSTRMGTRTIATIGTGVLSHWPLGYHDFLRRLARSCMNQRPGAVGLTAQFQSFYDSMFKRRACAPEIDFLKKEFVQFGCSHWGQGTVDPRFVFPDMERQWVSLDELAKEKNINRATLKSWITNGVVPATKVGGRYVIDRADATFSPRARGMLLSCKAAAKQLGFPAPVLAILKRTRHFPAVHLPISAAGFDSRDVSTFQRVLVQKASLEETESSRLASTISLVDLMRHFKFGSNDGKAEFVKKYIRGEIKPAFRIGDSVNDIYFNRKAAEEYARKCRLDSLKLNHCSQEDAAWLLKCDPKAIAGLLREGLLKAYATGSKTCVIRDSITSFSNTWVSVASIARSVASTSARLERLAVEAGIEMLSVASFYVEGERSLFVKRSDQDRLLVENEKDRETKISG